MPILVVEDEVKIANFIKKGLEMERYVVDVVHGGEEALAKTEINDYDVIVLDLRLPDKDGLEVCRELREKQNISTPILILTALGSVEDRIKGLDAGADDYLVKPFSFAEFFARLRALRRREKTTKLPKFQVADLVLDPATHEVTRGGREITLTHKEYRLLDYMIRRPGRVCTRTMLAEHVWGYNFPSDGSNVIDTSVASIRKKIDRAFPRKLIQTVRFVGYRIVDSKGRNLRTRGKEAAE